MSTCLNLNRLACLPCQNDVKDAQSSNRFCALISYRTDARSLKVKAGNRVCALSASSVTTDVYKNAASENIVLHGKNNTQKYQSMRRKFKRVHPHALSVSKRCVNDNGRRLKYDASNPDGVCRWCQGPVQLPRRTFCNDACVHEYLIRSNNRYMRECIWERDRGTCSACNVRTSRIGKAILNATNSEEERELRLAYSVPPRRKVWRSKFCSAVFDVDHIQPVVEGGGQCGLDNLRTLCLACHKAVTWAACISKQKV